MSITSKFASYKRAILSDKMDGPDWADTGQPGGQNINSNEHTTTEAAIQNNHTQTFAEKTKQKPKQNPNQNNFPNTKLAIVMKTINDISKEEYVYAVGDKIGPTNITHISKISNQRMCIFLKSQELVQEFTRKYPHIQIQNETIAIRPYIQQAIRIVISNACPSIPHNIIEEKLISYGIKTLSDMSFIRAGINKEGYSHILCFRRQIYIHPDDDDKIPESIAFKYAESDYKIYLLIEKTACIVCKKFGHKSENCRYNPNNNTEQNNRQETPNTSQNTNQEERNTINNIKPHENDQKYPSQERQRKEKRSLQSFSSSDSLNEPTEEQPNKIENTTFELLFQELTQQEKIQSSPQTSSMPTDHPQTTNQSNEQTPKQNEYKTPNKNTDTNTTKKNPSKRIRSLSPNCDLTIEQLTTQLKVEMKKNKKKYIMTYHELKEFLEKANGSPDPLKISRHYTEKTTEILKMMQELQPFLQHSSIKNRFTRIRNKINIQLEDELELDNDSEPDTTKNKIN